MSAKPQCVALDCSLYVVCDPLLLCLYAYVPIEGNPRFRPRRSIADMFLSPSR